jgi:pepF/M3 family oligoendopeptidase
MPSTEITDVPRWDLTPLYSSLDGQDYRAAFSQLEAELGALEAFFNEHQIGRISPPARLDSQVAGVLAEVLTRANALLFRADRLEGFLNALVTTNSYETAAQREMSKLDKLDIRRRNLFVRLEGWIGSLAPHLPELIGHSDLLREHAFFLSDTAHQSQFLMSEELEALAADLCIDGGTAFGKLQGNVTSQLKVPLERNGQVEILPITVVRNLCFDPNPDTRKRAYEAEVKGWESIRTTIAACINGVKGTATTLARRRSRPSVLDAALDQNRIDRPTLDALLGAIRESFPMFRGYLRSKAKKLGQEQLHWWDIFAPLGLAHSSFQWHEARDFIVDKFGRFSGELGTFAARAFDEQWIDGQPRDGKRGGAYCMGIMDIEQSRVLANFDGSFEQVSTLAHELGHAYHNECQQGLKPLLRGAPSTLAETASIFCETLIAEAALEKASHDEQLMILEAQIAGATQVCLDISSRFLFESALLERRAASELSAEELCELMLKAQAETYGDAIEPATYHPYMWLWKPHYYSYVHNFYNFPYAFGHLFSLGLYAIYREQGAAFVPRYRELLRATGQDYAAPLAARFGIDIRTPEFWRQSLAIVAEQVRRYEAL